MNMLKGNKLQKRLNDLGFPTDGTDWDDPKNKSDDGERWEE